MAISLDINEPIVIILVSVGGEEILRLCSIQSNNSQGSQTDEQLNSRMHSLFNPLVSSQRLLSEHFIKSIVEQAMANKSSLTFFQQEAHDACKQLAEQLMGAKKLRYESRFAKWNKKMKIFTCLNNYIHFDRIYGYIVRKINTSFCEAKIHQERINAQRKKYNSKWKKFNFQLVELVQNYQQNYDDNYFREILQETNDLIATQFGSKFKKVIYEQADLIDNFLKKIHRNPNFNTQEQFFDSQNFKEDAFEDKFYQFPDFSNYKDVNRKPIKSLILNQNDRQQLEHYCKQALAFLALNVENERKKYRSTNPSTFSTPRKTFKIETSSKDIKKSLTIHATERSKGSRSLMRIETNKINETERFIQEQKKSCVYSRYGQNDWVSSKQIIDHPSKKANLVKPISTTRRFSNSNDFFRKCIDFAPEVKRKLQIQEEKENRDTINKEKKKIKRYNQKRYYDRRIEHIIKETIQQQEKNRLEKQTLKSYISETEKQAIPRSENEADILIKQIKYQIIEVNKQKIYPKLCGRLARKTTSLLTSYKK